MVEAQKLRVEEAMTKMLNEIDVSHLRKMQAKMHRCAAVCCDSETKSVEEVHRCVERCSAPLNGAHKFVQEELNHFQDRLQRCVMQCNDKIRDKMTPNPSEDEVAKYTKEFETCATQCVNTHIGLVPGLLKKMRQALSDPKFNQDRVG
ncbi:hypothetical protein R5R35_014439 [Gryllus longicercus]|uniref:Protein FAM136A n=1 Tax=Gryllus longicercus TaxID=2509291 RepID=A0AAN9UZL8_9ORTH|nr:Uncharacterized protein GBIM_06571 [Gryllus bimaculatus]